MNQTFRPVPSEQACSGSQPGPDEGQVGWTGGLRPVEPDARPPLFFLQFRSAPAAPHDPRLLPH